jgi:hypothetical protein
MAFNGTTAEDIRMAATGWRKRQIMEKYCSFCKQECDVDEIDEGIGAYEYWGATGVDVKMVEVSSCCGEEVLNEPPEEDDNEELDK